MSNDPQDLIRQQIKDAREYNDKEENKKPQLEEFIYCTSQDIYVDRLTGTQMGPKGVDSSILKEHWETQENEKGEIKGVKPSLTIADPGKGLVVQSLAWWPGKPEILSNTTAGGLKMAHGRRAFNTYIEHRHPPKPQSASHELWVNHVKLLYPEPAVHNHFFDWAAACLRDPSRKINHCVMMSGFQGVGKDTILAPLRAATGDNTTAIGPEQLVQPYNGYMKCVLLTINELRSADTNFKASNLYESMKTLLAAPPDELEINDKYTKKITAKNVCRVIITTNDVNSMYIPDNDRRIFIMDSKVRAAPPKHGTPGVDYDPANFDEGSPLTEEYFNALWASILTEDSTESYQNGYQAVVEWLAERDLNQFNYNGHAPLTDAKSGVINSGAASRRSPLDEFLDDFLEDHAGLKVIFKNDLVEANQKLGGLDGAELVGRELTSSKRLHHLMRERGFEYHSSGVNGSYKRGSYRARIAYVVASVPPEERHAACKEAVTTRPLSFGKPGENGF
jgi:hypothetical protein